MKITIFQIKFVHSVIFWVMSASVIYSLYSGITGRITAWTWASVGLILVETAALALSGWRCPLTIMAERRGAGRGSVTDIFLPRRLAEMTFPVCGTTFIIALALILWRVLSR